MDDDAEFDVIDGVRLVRIKPKPKKNKFIIQDNSEVHVEEVEGIPMVRVEQKFLRDRRPIWSDVEIRELIAVMKEKNVMPLLNGRQYRRSDVFKIVAEGMKKRGFQRTVEQVNIKWKHLRLCYFKAKAKFASDEERKMEFPFYDDVDQLFGGGQPAPAENFITIEQFNEMLNKKQMQTMEIDGQQFFKQEPISPPDTSPVKESPTREEIQDPRESCITKALEDFQRNWQSMVLRVAEQEAEHIKIEKERELAEQREWEERLIEKQCAAMSKINQEFLAGLREIFQGIKKEKE